ncbi:hypothetical protein OUZ56_012814 [Daphnia magna]|uniref:Uncharacterized protein n=1 Tax=Daphnia magna TaxID=35525 RepID=A0ABQ9Z456_9CRUS|nr:hypothetical protein OUZ56_012814 [Daphnia magna]
MKPTGTPSAIHRRKQFTRQRRHNNRPQPYCGPIDPIQTTERGCEVPKSNGHRRQVVSSTISSPLEETPQSYSSKVAQHETAKTPQETTAQQHPGRNNQTNKLPIKQNINIYLVNAYTTKSQEGVSAKSEHHSQRASQSYRHQPNHATDPRLVSAAEPTPPPPTNYDCITHPLDARASNTRPE